MIMKKAVSFVKIDDDFEIFTSFSRVDVLSMSVF